MHRISKIAALALIGGIGVIATATTASASVTFDPVNGTGFVGKGDVQTPFGWNDATLQRNAPGVSFSYQSTSDDTYEVVCEWDTGSKHIVHHVQNKSATVTDTVAYDAKSGSRLNPNAKVTGFNLLGLDHVTLSSNGEVPVVGAACPATGNEEGTDASVTKLITSVEKVSSTGTQTLSALYPSLSLQAVVWSLTA